LERLYEDQVPDVVAADSAPASPRGGFAVGTRDDHHVAIRVAEPDLAVARRGVHVGLQGHLGAERAGGAVEILRLEPEQDPVPVRRGIGVHEVRVVLVVPAVELEDQVAVRVQPLVDVAVIASCVQPLEAEGA
jgi:hypothetical protein